jgi:hypothetical protein
MTAGPARRPVSTAGHRNQKRPGLRCSPRRPADGRRRVPSRSCARRGTMGSNRRRRDARDRCGAEPRRHRDAGPPPSACPPQAPSWFPLIPRGSSVDDDRTSEPSSARLRSRDRAGHGPRPEACRCGDLRSLVGHAAWLFGPRAVNKVARVPQALRAAAAVVGGGPSARARLRRALAADAVPWRQQNGRPALRLERAAERADGAVTRLPLLVEPVGKTLGGVESSKLRLRPARPNGVVAHLQAEPSGDVHPTIVEIHRETRAARLFPTASVQGSSEPPLDGTGASG